MGSGCKDGGQTGLIRQAMTALFNKIESLKHQIEFQLHVSFIEILKEEVRDLLDPNSSNKSDTIANGGQNGKVNIPGKPPIQIRETSNGVITLAGSTECSVQSLKEMADYLEHGSLQEKSKINKPDRNAMKGARAGRLQRNKMVQNMKPSKVVKTPEGNEAAVKQVVKSAVKQVNVPSTS